MSFVTIIVAAVAIVTLTATPQQQEQAPRVQGGWPCVGRPDPAYVAVAEGTGGQVFLFDPSEVAGSGVLAAARMQHKSTIFRVAGSLAEGVHEFAVPVDAIESLLVSVSLQCLQVVEIVRPSGRPVQEGETGVAWHPFQAGRIVTISDPEVGTWRITVAGRGLFMLLAQARTERSLDSVQFVRRGGRPGHEGLLPLGEAPRAGVPQLIRLALSGPARSVRARLVTAAFDEITPVPLAPLSSDDHGQEWVGTVTPPAGGFRVVVNGIDEEGRPFQRVHAPLLRATPR